MRMLRLKQNFSSCICTKETTYTPKTEKLVAFWMTASFLMTMQIGDSKIRMALTDNDYEASRAVITNRPLGPGKSYLLPIS